MKTTTLKAGAQDWKQTKDLIERGILNIGRSLRYIRQTPETLVLE